MDYSFVTVESCRHRIMWFHDINMDPVIWSHLTLCTTASESIRATGLLPELEPEGLKD